MSLLEAPYLIEAPPDGSASSYRLVAPPQKKKRPVLLVRIWRNPYTTYVVQDHNGSQDNLFCWCGLRYSHGSVTNYKRPYDPQMARNRSAFSSVLAPGASNRDNTVHAIWCLYIFVIKSIFKFKMASGKQIILQYSSFDFIMNFDISWMM